MPSLCLTASNSPPYPKARITFWRRKELRPLLDKWDLDDIQQLLEALQAPECPRPATAGHPERKFLVRCGLGGGRRRETGVWRGLEGQGSPRARGHWVRSCVPGGLIELTLLGIPEGRDWGQGIRGTRLPWVQYPHHDTTPPKKHFWAVFSGGTSQVSWSQIFLLLTLV